MIEFIECFKPNQIFYKFYKENYYEFIEQVFPGYYYNYQSVVTWQYNNKKHCFSNKRLKHIPLKNWEGIAFILESKKELVICNSDGSIRFKIIVPEAFNSNKRFSKRIKFVKIRNKTFNK